MEALTPSLAMQTGWLLLLGIPVGCVAWTVTHEEVFREPREFCEQKSKTCRNLLQRKFFYLFTCEYCFSHYVTAGFLIITRYKLLFDDWRGYLLSLFALVFVFNVDRVEMKVKEKHIEQIEQTGSVNERENHG